MKYLFTLVLLVCLFKLSNAQDLQSPSEFLGYPIGSEFTRHHQVIDYFNYLSQISPLATFSSYGQTNERRTLSYAVITSEENHHNLEGIRKNNLKQTGILEGDSSPEIAIVWLSYNVHGNEASSAEASMVTAFELMTNQKNVLNNTVVIIDPTVNPDGRDRYVNW
jgi:hypothetical protein